MKKRICLLIIFVMLMVLGTSRVDAIVMWMQCTNDVNETLEDLDHPLNNDGFKNYNTFALINSPAGYGKHLFYNPNHFYADSNNFGPTFIYYGSSGKDNGEANPCWYDEWYDDIDGRISECDAEDGFLTYDMLLDGYCPVGFHQTTGINTWGPTRGDFVVMWDKKPAIHKEELFDSIFVIYEFKIKNSGYYGDRFLTNETFVMVESYNIDGRYSFATNFDYGIPGLAAEIILPHGNLSSLFDAKDSLLKNWMTKAGIETLDNLNIVYTFLALTGMLPTDSNDSLAYSSKYDDEYMDWAMFTQAHRVANCGKDYFRLLKEPDNTGRICSRLIGAVQPMIQSFEITKTIYRSDDANREFEKWVRDWLTVNNEDISTQLGLLGNFEAGVNENKNNYDTDKYVKLVQVSKEIEGAIDDNEKFSFGDDYSVNDMLNDLSLAYDDLSNVLVNTEVNYDFYNNECQVSQTTPDPNAAILSNFNCDTFGVPETSRLLLSHQAKLIDQVILEVLDRKVSNAFGSGVGLQNVMTKGKEYLSLLTKASLYMQQKMKFDELTNKQIEDITKLYLELAQLFDIHVVVDCETLLGTELVADINEYLDIIKIAVPIVVIGLGVIDFTKAMFAGNDDDMKKAQKTFAKRLLIAFLIFLTPTFVNVLLTIANEVWKFIEPGTCGLF